VSSLTGTISVHGGTITNAQMIENASQIQISRRFAILLFNNVRLSAKKKPVRSRPVDETNSDFLWFFDLLAEKICVLKSCQDARVTNVLPFKFWQFGLVAGCGNRLEAADTDSIHGSFRV